MLGDLPDGRGLTHATALSADGKVVAGEAITLQGQIGFRWEAATGMQSIGALRPFQADTWVHGISGDGSVIVGRARPPEGTGSRSRAPFAWDAAAGMRRINEPNEDGYFGAGVAFDVSQDGQVVVGDLGDRAFRWNEGIGMQLMDPSGLLLDPNDPFPYQWALAVSGDGSVIVGEYHGNETSGQEVNGPFIWNARDGMRRLDTMLRTAGVEGMDRLGLGGAYDISADGTRVLVRGYHRDFGPLPVLVTIPEPTTTLLLGLGLAALGHSRRHRS